MQKNRYLLLFVLAAIVTLFAVTEVIAQPTFPTAANECMVIYGTKNTDWFTIGLDYGPNGEWPVQTTCRLDDGSTREVSKYDYVITGGKWSAAAYYQTIPGMRPGNDQYDIDLDCSFSSVNYIPPGEGTGSGKVPCFADYLGERALVAYTSAPSGSPKKFGHSSQSSGIGWTSLAIAVGSNVFFCRQYDEDGIPVGYGLPGPEVGATRIIKTTEELRWVGPKLIRFVIDYENCTYTAYDTDNPTVPLEQFPLQELEIGKVGGTKEKIKENWGHGKCDHFTLAVGENSCLLDCLGGWFINICW